MNYINNQTKLNLIIINKMIIIYKRKINNKYKYNQIEEDWVIYFLRIDILKYFKIFQVMNKMMKHIIVKKI